MNFIQYRDLIKSVKHGKMLPTAIYLHHSAIDEVLPEVLLQFIRQSMTELKLNPNWNLLKLYKRDFKITLLHYPDFDDYAYPALAQSTTIDLAELTYRTANYSKSENPPILHRKETFVLENHPHIETFRAVTEEGENIGLYQNTKTIGFKQQWTRLIKRKGYQLDDSGRLQPLANLVDNECVDNPSAITDTDTSITIQRHLTAINRDKLSAPFQKLAQHDYLSGKYSVLDYGCGKGDDARELEAHGLDINSWDPVHKPDGKPALSDIVNLGFVLNVIEDQHERQQTLLKAWQHADRILMVSVMISGDAKINQFKRYKDGVITQRNTFQKYYAQAEIRSYIEQVLKTNAVAMGQGIFAVFKDKDLEEEFYLNRQYQKRAWQQQTTRPIAKVQSQAVKKTLYDKHNELFNDFWQQCLFLGRLPANDEFELSDNIRAVIGSHKKAFELLESCVEQTQFKVAQQQRRNDVLVYFALSLFEKRKAKAHIPARLQRDIKVLFDSYASCIDAAKELLFSVGKPGNIAEACDQAFATFQCGQLTQSHSYIFDKALLNEMPSAIRVYIGCAVQLYGDLDNIDLLKVHIRSGKVTLLRYDDFENKALPLLSERIKIRLIDLDIDFFSYGDQYPFQPLYDKSVYLAPATNELKAQHAFEKRLMKQLEGLPIDQLPDWDILQKVFEYRGVVLKGNKFCKLNT